MTFYVKIANHTFKITPVNDKICKYFSDYIIPDDAKAFDISTDKEKLSEVKTAPGAEIYTPAMLELLMLHRNASEYLAKNDAFLFHGSAVAVDGEAYIFTAESGTGKSTHTRLWRKKFGDRAIMINDDKPFILISDGKAYACGSPWNGKHRLSTNIIMPVKAVCILDRGESNKIHKISKNEAMPKLIEQAYRPSDSGALYNTLRMLDTTASFAGLYKLSCNMEPEAADVAYNAMKG